MMIVACVCVYLFNCIINNNTIDYNIDISQNKRRIKWHRILIKNLN